MEGFLLSSSTLSAVHAVQFDCVVSFVDMLDVEGVNWKQMLCACTLTWLECGCGSKLKMAERLENKERKSGSYLKYHCFKTDLAITIKL